uniref:Reverse transcriptase domain-containing protein n=1 Tax=Lactuca sativa TaxID=4236 RepID=A0A9R1VE85_LACSA|nr:hypothetical protein LSAT_V11C500253900 [Lactuca sativa]
MKSDIIVPTNNFAIVYIHDVLIISKYVDQHIKHLNKFYELIYENGLAISATKLHLFEEKNRFLGRDIIKITIRPIIRSLELSTKFPDEIKDKKQIQRFLGMFKLYT